ncbi:MAG: NAD(P)H-hydrate dehydratase, partial [Nitrospirota bacterium]|nr:NAD(P)H-hydrate dehydratase [Nitrospirota bacterium]
IPPEYIDSMRVKVNLLTSDMIRQWIPARPRSAHKGTFGHLGLIAGSTGKSGAAALSARAALRCGTGLVTIATPTNVNPILETLTLEAMTVPMPQTAEGSLSLDAAPHLENFAQERNALAIGPGLSTQAETVELVRSFIGSLDRPSIIDADALNALAGHTSILKACRTPPILTPHPGEMARLLGKGTAQDVNQDRLGVARQFAQNHGCILVLKGAQTVMANADQEISICPTGNPGMASAGMGDALTGIIGGLLAQGLPPWKAAQAGVFLHGLAGDIGARQYGEIGLLASDLIDSIPAAFQQILGNSGL